MRLFRIETRSKVYTRLQLAAASAFLLMFYLINQHLPVTLHNIQLMSDKLTQSASRDALAYRNGWFGRSASEIGLEPQILTPGKPLVEKPEKPTAGELRPQVMVSIQGHTGWFRLDSTQTHSVVYQTYLDRYQLQPPIDSMPMMVDGRAVHPVFVDMVLGSRQHAMNNVLLWIQPTVLHQPSSTDVDGVLGADIANSYYRLYGASLPRDLNKGSHPL